MRSRTSVSGDRSVPIGRDGAALRATPLPPGRIGETEYDRFNLKIMEAGAMRRWWGLLLIVLGVVANNIVYLQDLWLGQGHISLDGWRSYGGLLISLALILVGLVLLARSRATV